MHPVLNPTSGHMALVAGIGLALMGLSVPGRRLQKLLGPLAFVVGLVLIVWAVFRDHWIAEGILLALILVAVLVESRSSREPTDDLPTALSIQYFEGGQGGAGSSDGGGGGGGAAAFGGIGGKGGDVVHVLPEHFDPSTFPRIRYRLDTGAQFSPNDNFPDVLLLAPIVTNLERRPISLGFHLTAVRDDSETKRPQPLGLIDTEPVVIPGDHAQQLDLKFKWYGMLFEPEIPEGGPLISGITLTLRIEDYVSGKTISISPFDKYPPPVDPIDA